MTKKILTQARLKELLHYDPDTGEFTWKIYRMWKARAGSKAGYCNSEGYVKINIGGVVHGAHRLAWLYMHGEFPIEDTDHINGNGYDNRIINLRSVTHLENARNQKLDGKNTSGVSGVGWHSGVKKWTARISGSSRVHLGCFDSFEHAVIARKAAEKALGYHKNHGRCKTHCK